MLGASVAPTIEQVAKMTAELAPVSACAAASRSTLPRARASLAISSVAVVSSIGIPARRAPAGSLIDSLRGTMETGDDAINRREQARAMRHAHPGRFLPVLFSARTAPVLWTFERGSAALVCGNAGLQSSAMVAAKPKKLERLMPSSVARRSILVIRLFGR